MAEFAAVGREVATGSLDARRGTRAARDPGGSGAASRERWHHPARTPPGRGSEWLRCLQSVADRSRSSRSPVPVRGSGELRRLGVPAADLPDRTSGGRVRLARRDHTYGARGDGRAGNSTAVLPQCRIVQSTGSRRARCLAPCAIALGHSSRPFRDPAEHRAHHGDGDAAGAGLDNAAPQCGRDHGALPSSPR